MPFSWLHLGFSSMGLYRALTSYNPTKRHVKSRRGVGHKGIGVVPFHPKKMEKNKFGCKGTIPAPCARNKTLTPLFFGAKVLFQCLCARAYRKGAMWVPFRWVQFTCT